VNRFTFWQTWLVMVGIVITCFGILLVLLPEIPLFDRQVNPVFWGGVEAPSPARNFQAWVYDVLGATVAGWGLLVVFIARHSFRRRERWAWNGLAGTLILWYILDTTASLYHGVIFNALFNTGLLLLAGLPLLFTHSQFQSE
jgi:hypothetical protein